MIYIYDVPRKDGRSYHWHIYADTTSELREALSQIGLYGSAILDRGAVNERASLTTTQKNKLKVAEVIDSRGVAKLIRAKRGKTPAELSGGGVKITTKPAESVDPPEE